MRSSHRSDYNVFGDGMGLCPRFNFSGHVSTLMLGTVDLNVPGRINVEGIALPTSQSVASHIDYRPSDWALVRVCIGKIILWFCPSWNLR
jgi:hypothetical protein